MIVDHVAHIEIKAENDPVIDRGFVKLTVQVHTVMTVTEFERFRAKPSILRLDPVKGKVQVEIAPTANRSEYEGSWIPPARS